LGGVEGRGGEERGIYDEEGAGGGTSWGGSEGGVGRQGVARWWGGRSVGLRKERFGWGVGGEVQGRDPLGRGGSG